MSDFFKENWIWIVAPVLVVIIAVVVILILSGDESGSEFIYNIH